MTSMSHTAVAKFDTHEAAEQAVRKLVAAGFEMDVLSVVGRGYHTDEKVVGFYNMGDRIRFWGARGAFWGGLWGLFLGGLFVTIPVAGPVFFLGYVAAAAASAIEGAAVVGGVSAIGAALAGIGIPRDSVLQYESEIVADGFLVMVHGFHDEMTRAEAILGTAKPARVVVHHDPAVQAAPATVATASPAHEKQIA
jgi:hypothetical protein